MRTRHIVLIGLLFLFAVSLPAAVTLPHLISDHMMLQRNIPVRIWGKASAGESVTVKFRGQTVSADADAGGRWEIYLKPLAAGSPADMRIEADNTIVVQDVLVGEVWVASGQSNMEFEVQRGNDAEAEIAAARYPRIRLFEVTKKTSGTPLDDVEGEWRLCSPDSVASFTAVGYFFARHLHRQLHVPVGIIQSAWGGTPAEAWTSMEKLRADPALWFYLRRWDTVLANYPSGMIRYEQRRTQWEKTPKARRQGRGPRPPLGPDHPHAPAALYNAMIAPLLPFNIRGAIWYQGESNAGADQAFLYRRLFPAMIEDWRARWGEGEFPFGFVQLANFTTSADWPALRESQTKTLHLVNTGMAVITDIGNSHNIHPKDKQDVGKRLGLWALATVYGKEVVYSGPMLRQMTVEGAKARLWFDHTGGGLKAAGGSLEGFVISGPDHIFHPATAKIDGATVMVSSQNVATPQAVRYAWENDPPNTLRNAEGLPASPFRTDRWQNGHMPARK